MSTSTVAPSQRKFGEETESTSQDDSTNTNNFVILDRAEDRVQNSGFDRRTRMISLNRLI
eukprot:6192427-Pyramimonas_sp.AAC.1